MNPQSEAGALCGVHPGAVAAFTCDRCGSFACEECRSVSRPGRCRPCAARDGARLGQDLSAAGLLRDTFKLLVTNLPAVGVVVAVMLLWQLQPWNLLGARPDGSGGLGLYRLTGSWGSSWLLTTLLGAATSAGFMRWVADGLLDEKPRRVAPALKAALGRALFLTIMHVLGGFLVLVGVVLLIVPGIYLFISLSLAPAALVIDGRGPVAALSRSDAIVRGHRWQLLTSVGGLRGLAWFVPFMLGASSALVMEMEPWLRTAITAFDVVVRSTLTCLPEIAIVLAYLRITRSPSPDRAPVPVPVSAAP